MSTVKPALPWHTATLSLLLAVWGVGSLIGMPLALQDVAQSMPLGFFDRCVFLSIPMLILVAARLLWVRSVGIVVILALLILVYLLAALRLYLNLQAWADDNDIAGVSFLESALPFLYAIGFFIACCFYCRYLWKHKLIS